jgi:uncharacterized protein YunC (DUF1805 family)
MRAGSSGHLNTHADSIGIHVGDSVKEAISKIVKHPSLTEIAENREAPAREKMGGKEGLKRRTRTQVHGVAIIVTDSITFLDEGNAGDIIVCGSHGGVSAGEYARKHGVRAVFFNDAGIGKNGAGANSLEPLNEAGILACTVDCMSAEIFNGQDTLDHGVISVCNQLARNRNIRAKMNLREAIKHI